jgi:hypothetical protein
MASVGEAARVLVPARPRPSGRARTRRRAARRSVAGGAVWIAVAAVLLAGVVALNVAVLRLNLRLDGLDAQRAKLHAENAALQSQLASAASSPHVQRLAERSGFVPADPTQTTYIRLNRPGP